jgi:hypothetical protein
MMSNLITVSVAGVEETIVIANRWQNPNLTERLKRAATRITAKVSADAVTDAPRDTGMLAESIETDVWSDDDGGVWGAVFTQLPYGLVMEYGRRPASEIGLHPPPEHALDAWAARHGMDEEVAEAMRWSIAIKGIEPHPFLRPALQAAGPFALHVVREELMRPDSD